MKKFVKLLALVVDVAFTPIRLIVATLSLASACIIHELNFKEAFIEMIETTVMQMQLGIKPTLDIIFEKESEA